MKIAVFGENGRKYAHRIDTKHFGNALLRNSHSFFRFYPSKEWSNVQIKSNSALRGCKMLEPSKERREITSRDRVFAKTSRDARRDLREIEKWIRSPPPGALHFYGKSERNPLFHPQKANRRAQSSRARDDAKRIFRFERRDVNKNAFTHRATRKRERLHVVLLNATTRDEFLLLPFFFFLSLSLFCVGCAVFFFLSRLLFPTSETDVDFLLFFGRTLTLWLALVQTLVYKRRKK